MTLRAVPMPPADGQHVLDHRTDFRLEMDQPGLRDARWWSVFLLLENTAIDALIARAAHHGFADDLIVPAAYTPAYRDQVQPLQPVSVFARYPLIKKMNLVQNAFGIREAILGSITPADYLDAQATPPDLSHIEVEKGTVVQAVIDDGIAIANDAFRDGTCASRIFFAQIFEAISTPEFPHTSIGRALEKHQIDALLERCTQDGFLDEDLFYRLSGQINWRHGVFSTVALAQSHGTAVASVLTERLPETAPKQAPIICAELPSRVTGDTSGLNLLPSLCLSMHILFDQARRFRYANQHETGENACAPVVFNLSYGNTSGPHDGTGMFAWLMDYYFDQHPTGTDQTAWLSLAAGNANLSRLHARLDQNRFKGPVGLELKPDDRTATNVEIWTDDQPLGAACDVTVVATPPFGPAVRVSSSGGSEKVALVDDSENIVAELGCRLVQGQTQRAHFSLNILPTFSLETKSVAPAGQWTIDVLFDNFGPTDGVDMWIGRDETLPGYKPGARQSQFVSDDYEAVDRFGRPLAVDPPESDCPIRRSNTMSGFAYGQTPIVVAAFNEQSALISDYSAAGPVTKTPEPDYAARSGPDVSAKGDDSNIRRGTICAGSRSGSFTRVSGTSIAAPRVARLATRDIYAHQSVDARTWIIAAQKTAPFDLRDSGEEKRTGAGGIQLSTASSATNAKTRGPD